MSIREFYDTHGELGYYSLYSQQYENPHKRYITELLSGMDFSGYKTGLDFACGDGLITKSVPEIEWVGVDPFMSDRYSRETSGNACISATMEQIANGEVSIPSVDIIVCSYCIDIFEKSYMENLMWMFYNSSDVLVTIRPNSKVIRSQWWESDNFMVLGKSRITTYIHKCL